MGFQPASGSLTYQTGASFVAAAQFLNTSSLIAPLVAPIVASTTREGYFVTFSPGPELDHVDSKRADGATYKRLNGKVGTTTFACVSRGVEHAIPRAKSRQWDPVLRGRLLDRYGAEAALKVRKDVEKEVADTLFNATTYNAGNSNGHAASNQWDTSTGVPATDIATAKSSIADRFDGVDDGDFFAVIPAALARKTILNTQLRTGLGAAFTREGVSPASMPIPMLAEALAEALGVGKVFIPNAGYRSGGTDAAPTLTKYWNPFYCGVGLLPKVETTDGGIALWRGVGVIPAWTEMVPVVEGDGQPVPISVVTYEENQTGSEVVQVDTYTDLKIVHQNAFYLITACDS